MSSPKEFHIDAVYPEPLSRLRRGHGAIATQMENPNSSSAYRRAVKKQRNRGNAGSARFRTQPITFQEIKEVDEDNIVEPESDNSLRGSYGTVASSSAFKSESDLKASFQLFYQSIKSGNDDEPLTTATPTKDLPLIDFPLQPDTSRGAPEKRADDPSNPSKTTSHLQTAPIAISFNTRTRQSF